MPGSPSMAPCTTSLGTSHSTRRVRALHGQSDSLGAASSTSSARHSGCKVGLGI
ncbi:unnamed protein product [Symbiodinium natans]|uniref:Uncharacterized protein n=1 Tax=Symbiodinium natans TaxID=878477 RepID=A0A812U0P8_9DINO|nr:unnamed protein product [Symbiodinium natans]